MTTLLKKLQSTGRTLYVDKEVLATAPKGVSEGELEFFHPDKHLTDKELAEEYKSRGLVPATIEDLIACSEKLDELKYVTTHWKDTEGKWCFASFDRWRDGLGVLVHRGYDRWDR